MVSPAPDRLRSAVTSNLRPPFARLHTSANLKMSESTRRPFPFAAAVSRRRYPSLASNAESITSVGTRPVPSSASRTTNPFRASESAAAATVEAEGSPVLTSAGEARTRYGGRFSSVLRSVSSSSAAGPTRLTGPSVSTSRSSSSSRKSPKALLASESISLGSPRRSSSPVAAVVSPPFGSSERRVLGAAFPSPRTRRRSTSSCPSSCPSSSSSSSLARRASATARADSREGGVQSAPALAVTNTYPPALDICSPSCTCSLAVTAAARLLRSLPPLVSSPNVSPSTEGSSPTDRRADTSASRRPARLRPQATTT